MKQEHERRMNAVKVMLRRCPALCAATPAVAGCSRCACTDLQALLRLVTNLRRSGSAWGWMGRAVLRGKTVTCPQVLSGAEAGGPRQSAEARPAQEE